MGQHASSQDPRAANSTALLSQTNFRPQTLCFHFCLPLRTSVWCGLISSCLIFQRSSQPALALPPAIIHRAARETRHIHTNPYAIFCSTYSAVSPSLREYSSNNGKSPRPYVLSPSMLPFKQSSSFLPCPRPPTPTWSFAVCFSTHFSCHKLRILAFEGSSMWNLISLVLTQFLSLFLETVAYASALGYLLFMFHLKISATPTFLSLESF